MHSIISEQYNVKRPKSITEIPIRHQSETLKSSKQLWVSICIHINIFRTGSQCTLRVASGKRVPWAMPVRLNVDS